MSFNLGNLTIAAGGLTKFDAPSDGVKAILIGAETGLTSTITMESGGVQKTLYPGTVDWFQVNKGFTGNILINPVAILNNASSFPATVLIFDAIGLNDPEQATMYPIALPARSANVGNSIPVSTSTTSVANDNNVAGTSVVEATPSGDGASAVQLSNTGVLVLGNATHKGSISSDNGLIVSDGAGNLAVGALKTNTIRDNVNGNVAMNLAAGDGSVTFPNGISISSGFLASIGGKQTTLNGSTSGTAVATCVLQSGITITTIFLNGFRNGNAGSQTLALPVTYLKGAHGLNGGTGIFSLLKNALTQNISQLITLGAGGSGGTVSTQTHVQDNNIWHLSTGFDSLSFAGSDAGSHTDFIIIIGL